MLIARLPSYVRVLLSCLVVALLIAFRPASAEAQSQEKLGELTPPRTREFGFRRAVIAGRYAYLIGEPEMLAGPSVVWASVSPGGDAVLAMRQRTPAFKSDALDAELFCWNRHTGRTTSLWRQNLRGEKLDINTGAWFADGAHAVLFVTESTRGTDGKESSANEAMIIDAPNARVRIMPLNDTVMALTPHPTRPLIALKVLDLARGRNLLRVMNSEGQIGASLELQLPILGDAEWMQDRLLISGVEVTRTEGGGFSRQYHYYHTDLTGNAFGPLTETEKPPAPSVPIKRAESPLRLEPEKQGEPKTAVGRAIWLVATDKDAMPSEPLHARICITKEAESEWLLPGLTGVVYYMRGGLYLAPLNRMDRAEFLTARNEAVRRTMLANFRQVVSAIQQYSMDSKSIPAANDGDLRDFVVGPKSYIIDDSAFRNPLTGELAFHYTYAGGSDFPPFGPNAPTIEMGYLTGPGGRYVWTNKGIDWHPSGGGSVKP